MNKLQLITSVKRELWEYKKIFMWVPITLVLLFVLMPVLSYLLNDFSQIQWQVRFDRLSEAQFNEHFTQFVSHAISVMFFPFLLVAGTVQLYYFIACLFDERRDLSILFWRSLPVSDAMSVGVKMLVGAIVLPAIFMLAATVTLLLYAFVIFIICIVLSIGYDLSMWGLLTHSGFIGHIFTSWAGLLPYALWMFPLYAWLMLVSAFANKAPFLWALLPAIIIVLVEQFFVHYLQMDIPMLSFAVIDYFSISQHDFVAAGTQMGWSFKPYQVIAEKVNLFALIIGALFMYGAYWMRKNKSL